MEQREILQLLTFCLLSVICCKFELERPMSHLHLVTVILLIVGTMLCMKGYPPEHGMSTYKRRRSTSPERLLSVQFTSIFKWNIPSKTLS